MNAPTSVPKGEFGSRIDADRPLLPLATHYRAAASLYLRASNAERPCGDFSMDLMEKLVSLAKRRGFIFPSSEIYGGLNGAWDYGPLGVELKRNIKQAWWERHDRPS